MKLFYAILFFLCFALDSSALGMEGKIKQMNFQKMKNWILKVFKRKEMSVYSAMCIVGDAGFLISNGVTVLNAHHNPPIYTHSKRQIEKALFIVLKTGRYSISMPQKP